EDEGDRGLVHLDLVDQPIARLAGQVPEQALPGDGAASRARGLDTLEGEHAAAVGGFGGLEAVAREGACEAGFSDARIAYQDDLGVLVAHRGVEGTLAQEGRLVDVPDANGTLNIGDGRDGRSRRVEGDRAGSFPARTAAAECSDWLP